MKYWNIENAPYNTGFVNGYEMARTPSIKALAAEYMAYEDRKLDDDEVTVEPCYGWPWDYAVERDGLFVYGFETQSQAERFAKLITE